MKKLIVIVIAIGLTSCMSNKSFNSRMVATAPVLEACMQQAVAIETAKAVTMPQFTNAQDATMWMLANALATQGKASPISECNRLAIVAFESDARTRGAVIGAGVSILSLGIGALAITSVADSFADLGKAKGNTTTISGSRVVSDSVNSSASGEGLGILNTNIADESLGIGGLQPRVLLNEDGSTISGSSASGADEPVTVDPGNDPVTLPVE